MVNFNQTGFAGPPADHSKIGIHQLILSAFNTDKNNTRIKVTYTLFIFSEGQADSRLSLEIGKKNVKGEQFALLQDEQEVWAFMER